MNSKAPAALIASPRAIEIRNFWIAARQIRCGDVGISDRTASAHLCALVEDGGAALDLRERALAVITGKQTVSGSAATLETIARDALDTARRQKPEREK